MRIGLFTDIHGNRQAFEACLADAQTHAISQYVFLGDYVGYGADPEWVMARIMDHVENGAIAIAGNHDRAVHDPGQSMNRLARIAIDWTRDRLSPAARDFLARLPLSVEDAGRLYVHGDASAPQRFHYVADSDSARVSMEATHAHLTFVGHVHAPALYSLAPTHKLTMFQPVSGVAIPAATHRKWLAVVGSVGQPRDRIAAAAYALFDTQSAEITFMRVPYDIEGAASRIRAAGLPEALADRLARGR